MSVAVPMIGVASSPEHQALNLGRLAKIAGNGQMESSFLENFFNRLEDSGLEVMPRLSNEDLWDRCFSDLIFQNFHLCNNLVKYYECYMEGYCEAAVDLSVIICSGGKPLALWLLSGEVSGSNVKVTSSGQPILAPVFLASTSVKLEARVVSAALNFLTSLSSTEAISPIVIQQGGAGASKTLSVSQWHRHAITQLDSLKVKYEMYVDLTLPEGEFRSHIRKSYKPLISKGLTEFDHCILESSNFADHTWDNFRNLHRKVAGRVTRSPATWCEQAGAIKVGRAFLVAVYTKKGRGMIGGAFFHITRDEGVYAVGAYDKEYAKKPLGHIAQMIAIKYMKDRGLLWYKIGDRAFQSDIPSPSDKEINISHFKEGFATTLLPRFEIALRT